MQQVKWPKPRLGPEQRTTFGIYAPTHSHTRPATCAEVGCERHRDGWSTPVAAGSLDELKLKRWMAGELDPHGARRALVRPAGPNMVRYHFPAGQACPQASTHRVTLERPMLHVVRGGDWRASYDVHTVSGEQWVNTFGTHQDRLARAINGSAQ